MRSRKTISVAIVVGDIRQRQGINQCVRQFISEKARYREEGIELVKLFSADGIYECDLDDLPQGISVGRLIGLKKIVKNSFFSNSFFGQAVLFLRNYLRLARKVSERIISSDTADVYLFHDLFAASRYLKKRQRNTKVVVVSHSDNDPLGQLLINRDKLAGTFVEKILRKKIEKVLLDADCVVTICESAYQYIESIGAKRIECITNGIKDLSADLIKKRQETIENFEPGEIIECAVVGTISDLKGQERLVDALARSSDEVKNRIRIHFYGTGHAEERIKEKIKSKKLENYFIFHGVVNCIEQHLLDKNILLHPSKKEAVPCAIIEALRESLPVWACDVGDISNMLSGYNAGKIFPSCTNGVMEMLTDVANSSKSIKEMSQEARKCYKAKFELSIQTNLYLELFFSLFEN